MQNLDITWERFSETAIMPTRIDGIRFMFKSDEYVTIHPGETVTVSTGIGFRMPNGLAALVYPNAGFYSQYFPRFLANTDGIALRIKLWNLGHQPVHIQRGTNICKMMCQQIFNTQNLSFHKLNDQALEPINPEGSAGWILKSPRDCVIHPNGFESILTGIGTSGIPSKRAILYPYHEFATINYELSNDPDQDLYVRFSNSSGEPIHISRGDDLGLIAFAQPLHLDIVQGPLAGPPRIPTFSSPRG